MNMTKLFDDNKTPRQRHFVAAMRSAGHFVTDCEQLGVSTRDIYLVCAGIHRLAAKEGIDLDALLDDEQAKFAQFLSFVTGEY
jgi:hypothetical protein